MRGVSQPTVPRGEVLASYSEYAGAQTMVDRLADGGFALESVSILGRDLQVVERITGRRTYASSAGRGLLSGLYLGVFACIAFLLLGAPGTTVVAIALIAVGAGVLWGVLSFAMSGGRRDFNSTGRQLVAARYEVVCDYAQAPQARQLLGLDPPVPPSDPAPLPTPTPTPATSTYARPGPAAAAPGSPPASSAPGSPPAGGGVAPEGPSSGEHPPGNRPPGNYPQSNYPPST